MIPAERQKKILKLLSASQIVSISTLVDTLNVSHMTIRRDIKTLEDMGHVISISGGVQLIERIDMEMRHDDKSELNQEEKEAIGILASQYVPYVGTIFLDAGTTTFKIVKYIKDYENLLVVTNDFEIANYLMRHGKCRIVHTGGTINKETYSCVGELAAAFVKRITIDVAFISTSSWSYDGTTTPDESKIVIKNTVVNNARKSILVSDSSKYGKLATFNVCDLSVFDTIITDQNLQRKAYNLLTSKGIRVELAS